MIDCSIIVPVYYNAGSLSPLVEELTKQVFTKNPALAFELIFVDDGSGDESWSECARLQAAHPMLIRAFRFTRNFGQVPALYAGFTRARGRCAVVMSADGQDPAVLINDMLQRWSQDNVEIVICTRASRDESLYRTLSSRIFYRLMRALSFPTMPLGGFDFVLIGRRALDMLLRYPETQPFLQGQLLWLGFSTVFIPYHRLKRAHGKSRWTFAKKITYLLDGVLSYSYRPIRIMSFMGILFALAGFLYACVIVILKLSNDIPVVGWAPLMVALLVIGGMQMFMLGVIGEYLWRTLAQVRRRPMYVVGAALDAVHAPATDPNIPVSRGMEQSV